MRNRAGLCLPLRAAWRVRLLGLPRALKRAGASFSDQPICRVRCNGRGFKFSLRMQSGEVFNNAVSRRA